MTCQVNIPTYTPMCAMEELPGIYHGGDLSQNGNPKIVATYIPMNMDCNRQTIQLLNMAQMLNCLVQGKHRGNQCSFQKINSGCSSKMYFQLLIPSNSHGYSYPMFHIHTYPGHIIIVCHHMSLNTMNNPFADASTPHLASSFTRFSSASNSSLLLLLALWKWRIGCRRYRHERVILQPLVVEHFAMEHGPFISIDDE